MPRAWHPEGVHRLRQSKGNADTERLIRTIKEELCWLREWSLVEELAIEMEKFVEYFNDNYLHSAIGYKTPNVFEAEWFKNNQFTRSATAWLVGRAVHVIFAVNNADSINAWVAEANLNEF